MTKRLDAHGQPDSLINAARRMRRMLNELLGLCRGIILDGVVSETEVTGLAEWIRTHDEVLDAWPADVIAARLERILADGFIDDDERSELQLLLEDVTGSDAETAALESRATTLPLDDPPPAIEIPHRSFCFTGRFYFGTRRACQDAVRDRDGLIHPGVRLNTDYLVIGLLGSRDWLHSSFGTKIQKAVQYRASTDIRIVSEQHWSRSISGQPKG